MKIAFVIHSLGIGGMERVMFHLLEEFSTYENLELHLILIGIKRELLFTLPNEVSVHRPSWAFNNSKRMYHTIKTVAFIRGTLKDISPNTVLSFGEMWNNLVLLASLGLKMPIYISDRSIPGKNLGKLQNLLRNKLYPLASGFIAQTEKSQNHAIRSDWNKNIQIIGNPVPVFQNRESTKRTNTVIMVSRLIPTKNADRLIQMFSKTNPSENWELIIVGGNAKKMNLLEAYQEEVKLKGLSDTVHLVGEQRNVHTYYAQASIFAFTSTSEGFPNALAEGMSAGCACIAYDCIAGPSDIIDDGINGFLIPEGDEKLFTQKLHLLMKDKILRERFGEAAREKMKTFEMAVISKKFYAFITKNVNLKNKLLN